jgi:hypothetical protein
MKIFGRVASFFVLVSAFVAITPAQSTVLTYQGNLVFEGTPANGNFDFQFSLFSAATGGSQLGLGVGINNVVVSNGSFSVFLNFGNQFPGATRFLEMRVRPAGQGSFTTLTPRQPMTSVPYAVKSLDSELLGGVPADQYVLTADARLSDARSPLPNSANYIQNRTTPQSSTNFNIAGSGTIGGTLDVTEASTFAKSVSVGTTLAVGQAATFASAMNVTGAINTNSQFNVGGNFVLNRSRLSLFNTLAVPRGFTFEMLNSPAFLVLKNDAGSILMTVTQGGKIGIGETSPTQAALEIVGGLRVGGLNTGHVCADSVGVLQTCTSLTGEAHDTAVKVAALEVTVREQRVEIERQRDELAALKELICSQNRAAAVCAPRNQYRR